ncbi:MAG: 50S ribosomal protein L10 [Fibrobacterota bacterium]
MKKSVLEEKEKNVLAVAKKIERASAVYLVDYLGLTVEEVNELRARLRSEKIVYKVMKNTLVARAFKARPGVTGLEKYLPGPTAVAISAADEIAPARIISEFSKKQKNNLPRFKAVVLGDTVFDEKQIAQLSKLPGKRELLSMLASALNAPLVKFAGTLQALVTQVAYAVNAVKEKKENEQK